MCTSNEQFVYPNCPDATYFEMILIVENWFDSAIKFARKHLQKLDDWELSEDLKDMKDFRAFVEAEAEIAAAGEGVKVKLKVAQVLRRNKELGKAGRRDEIRQKEKDRILQEEKEHRERIERDRRENEELERKRKEEMARREREEIRRRKEEEIRRQEEELKRAEEDSERTRNEKHRKKKVNDWERYTEEMERKHKEREEIRQREQEEFRRYMEEEARRRGDKGKDEQEARKQYFEKDPNLEGFRSHLEEELRRRAEKAQEEQEAQRQRDEKRRKEEHKRRKAGERRAKEKQEQERTRSAQDEQQHLRDFFGWDELKPTQSNLQKLATKSKNVLEQSDLIRFLNWLYEAFPPVEPHRSRFESLIAVTPISRTDYRKILMIYHPDKNSQHEATWRTSCEEISKVIAPD